MADALNARTFALAQQLGLPLMNICSTCQGIESMVQDKLTKRPEYLEKVNAILADEGLHVHAGPRDQELPLDPRRGLRARQDEEHGEAAAHRHHASGRSTAATSSARARSSARTSTPDRDTYLEKVIEAVGAEVVDYEGKKKCCGFPLLTINRENSLKQAGNHIHEAQDLGADALVSPCPLCHLNLDAQQPAAKQVTQYDIDLPIIHLPQMIGLALGIPPKEMRMDHHVVSTKKLLAKLGAPAAV